ncbi:MAG: 3'(2'),5'-bisphosphate nucleotidase CysQ [Proteobacteria bacterium]|nr:3'(2'),5'-bisphosphate nucleotidase CysQ [Pseudomonadota bacterium]
MAMQTDGKTLPRLLPEVRRIARVAGGIIMHFYAAAETRPEIVNTQIKDDDSPVTVADHASGALIETRLAALTPGITVVTEENDTLPEDDAGLYWAVDPLDGTNEFLDRTDGFCVRIALMDNYAPVLAVIFSPVQDMSYFGIAGGAAFRQDGTLAPVIMQTRQAGSAGEKGYLRTLFNAKHADIGFYKENSGNLSIFRGLNLPEAPDAEPGLPRTMQVADGLADLHVNTGKPGPTPETRLTRTSGYIWDNAADDLILRNAGGITVQLSDGMPLSFRQPAREKMPAHIAFGDIKLGIKAFPELKKFANN